MAVLKTTVGLSLAVLIAFGTTGCNSNQDHGTVNNADTGTSQSAPAEVKPEEAESGPQAEAEKTLNELAEIGFSDEYKDMKKDLADIKNGDQETIAKVSAILSKHQGTLNHIRKLGYYDKATIESSVGTFNEYIDESARKFSYEDIENLYLLAIPEEFVGMLNEDPENSFDTIDDAVIDEDGKEVIKTSDVFIKDKNDAIFNFMVSTSSKFTLENGGKTVVFSNVGSGRSDETVKAWLEADVKNAATVVETWIVYQGSTAVPIVMDGHSIVSGQLKEEYTLKASEGVKFEVTGNSFEYIIKGTAEGSDIEVTYDNVRGGLQRITSKDPSKTYDRDVFNDYLRGMKTADYSTVEEYVDYLNSDEHTSDATFEAVEVNGEDYVRVTAPASKIKTEEGLLYSTYKLL